MAKFPEPPPAADLARIAPEIRVLPIGTLLWRAYLRGGKHPTLWNAFRAYGPTGSRFDHHTPPARLQERQILYAAALGPTCLAELFQDARVIDRMARDPWLVGFQLIESLRLLDLTGVWPTRAGASMVLNSGPRPRARRWARAIYEAFPDLHGLYYPSSMHANSPAMALFERAAPALSPHPDFHRSLADPSILPALAHAAVDLGYGLV